MNYLIRDKLVDKKLALMNWQIGGDKKSQYEEQMIDQLKVQIEELEYGLNEGYTHMDDDWNMWGEATQDDIAEKLDLEETQNKLLADC